MVKDWESVRVDVCRHYAEGKSLTQVRQMMLRDRKFKASERSYRLKLAEWKAKRADSVNFNENAVSQVVCAQESTSKPLLHHTPSTSGIFRVYMGQLDRSNPAIDEHDVGQSMISIGSSTYLHGYGDSMQPRMSRDQQFDNVLRLMHEAPFAFSAENILHPWVFHSNGNLLLQYTAARGHISGVLTELLRVCTVEILEEQYIPALQTAILNDRVDNVRVLLLYGAHLSQTSPTGESALHLAVMTSQSPELIELLLQPPSKSNNDYSNNGVNLPVSPPSNKAGRVTLDLVVERLLQDISRAGKPECTHSTKKILLKVLQWTSTIENPEFLREHARENCVLFNDAVKVLGKYDSAKWLCSTMTQVLHDEMQQTRPALSLHFYYEANLAQMWRPSRS